jgi:hypothetical protein
MGNQANIWGRCHHGPGKRTSFFLLKGSALPPEFVANARAVANFPYGRTRVLPWLLLAERSGRG